MNIFIFMAAFLLLDMISFTVAASSSWSLKFNRDFITGEYYVYPYSSGIFSIGTQEKNYTSPFMNTIQTAAQVHYTTKTISAYTFNVSYPLNTTQKNVQYYIEKLDVGKSFLKTKLTGFIDYSYMSVLCYQFIIILNNNRIFNTHIVIDTITFNNTNPTYTQYPSKYSSGDTIMVCTMLRDLKVEYSYSDQISSGKIFRFETDNILMANQTVRSTLQISPYLDNPDGRYSIRFLVLIIDQTRLSIDYNYYRSYVGLSINVYSGFVIPTNLNPGISSSYTTYISGVSGLTYLNNRELSFHFSINSTNSSQLKSACLGNNCEFNFSYWITEYYDCDGPQWINVGSLCYDNCTSTQYFEFSNLTCQPCDARCLTCYDATACRQCITSQNRVLMNVSCVPAYGFYQSGSLIASRCHINCLTCNGSATQCTSCYNTSLLVGTTCQICSNIYQGCVICDSTACLSCDSPYRHINRTYCNLPCSDPNCDVCSNSNTSFCFVCIPTSHRVINNQGQCVPICGDRVVMDYEQCDDGNFDDHDGCSSCMIEPHYNCTNLLSVQGYLYTAYCSYLLALNFSLIAQQKLEGSNSLRFILTVDQYRQHFWKSFQIFDGFIMLSAKHSNLKASFISQWTFSNRLLLLNSEISPRMQGYVPQQYFQIIFQYREELHNLPLTLSFAFNRSSDPRVNTIPLFNQIFTVLPENNQYAHLYLSQTYQHQSYIKNIIFVECILLLVGYIIACFCRCKRIIAESIMVAQLAFAGLVSVEWTNPLHSALKALAILFNPLNLLQSPSYRPFDDPLIPNRLRGMGLYSNLLFNLNTGLAFMLAPILVGSLLKLLSLFRCFQDQRRKKLSEYGKIWLTDFVFAGITILGCAFGCSLALQINYAIKDFAYSGMIGIVICGIVLLLLVVYMVVWLKHSHFFAEYHQILNNKGAVQLIFSLIYSFSGLVIAFTSFMLYTDKYLTIVVILFSLLMLLFLHFKTVYKKSRDKIRVQVNLLTVILTQSAYLIDKFCHGYSHLSTSSLFMAGTMIIPLSLSINLLINFSFLAYQLIKTVREWQAQRAQQKMQHQEKNYISQKNVEMKKIFLNSQDNPLSSINEPKINNPLLEGSGVEANDSANFILREELNKFLEMEKLEAQQVLKKLEVTPKHGKHSLRHKGREKYCQHMILGEQYKELGQL